MSGGVANANPIRWSTKYADPESNLVFYGFRYYQAAAGRWLNKDPLKERGSRNLFAFTANRPTSLVDSDGRRIVPEVEPNDNHTPNPNYWPSGKPPTASNPPYSGEFPWGNRPWERVNLKTKDCDLEQVAKISELLKQALAKIAAATNSLSEALSGTNSPAQVPGFGAWFGFKGDAGNVWSRISPILANGSLGSPIEFQCKECCEPGRAAETPRVAGKHYGAIGLCPLFFEDPIDFRRLKTMIHELSHHFGDTRDYGYLSAPPMEGNPGKYQNEWGNPVSVPVENLPANADTIANWVTSSF